MQVLLLLLILSFGVTQVTAASLLLSSSSTELSNNNAVTITKINDEHYQPVDVLGVTTDKAFKNKNHLRSSSLHQQIEDTTNHDHIRRIGPEPNSTSSVVEQNSLIGFIPSKTENKSYHKNHLRSNTIHHMKEKEFYNNVISHNRNLQNTCGWSCNSDSDCCSNSGGCNCCDDGTCTNDFECGRESVCWEGPNTCVDTYDGLQSAFNLVQSGQTIKICKNSVITVSNAGQNLICHQNHITVECENNNNCIIQRNIASNNNNNVGRVMTFTGNDITLRRLTIQNGQLTTQGGGGGVYVQGLANIQGCTFNNNQALQGYGGAASIGQGSSVPAFTGSSNVARYNGNPSCEGIYNRATQSCYFTQSDTSIQNKNVLESNPNSQCGIECFSNDNCKGTEGKMNGMCRTCDNEESSPTFGKCIIDPNDNDDTRLYSQCGHSCSVDYDCSSRNGPCQTCELNKCIDETQRVIVPSARNCVFNQGMLQTGLNSPNEQVIEICANTNIVLTHEIVVPNGNKILRCQGDISQGCYITREGSSPTKHRLLTFGNNIRVRHITLQGGYSLTGDGGCINFLGNELEISHCNFIGCTARRGGAIALPSVSSTTIFQSNTAAGNVGTGGCPNVAVIGTNGSVRCLNL